MTEESFNNLKRDSSKIPVSPFFKFCLDTKGFVFKSKRGKPLDKWEVFTMGYTDTMALSEGRTGLTATNGFEHESRL